MSIVVPTPPSPSENRDSQFINFTEEFRRAKRTSLVWSALTIVASLGSDIGSEAPSNALRFYGTNLAYSQPLLVFLLFAASLFFFLGYLRSGRIIKALNSAAAENADKSWTTVKDTIDGIRNRLTKPNSRISEAEKDASDVLKWIDDFRLEAQHIISQSNRSIDDENFKLAKNNFEAACKDSSPTLGSLKKSADRLSKAASLKYNQFANEISKLDKLADSLKPRTKDSISKITDSKTDIETMLSDLSDSLSKFRDAISASEKRWHFWYDTMSVYSLFLLALTGVVWHCRIPVFESIGSIYGHLI